MSSQEEGCELTCTHGEMCELTGEYEFTGQSVSSRGKRCELMGECEFSEQSVSSRGKGYEFMRAHETRYELTRHSLNSRVSVSSQNKAWTHG